MSFSIFKQAIEKDLDDLYYQLIGVVDISYAIENYDMDLIQEFLLKDHPAKNINLKPCFIESLDKTEQHSPFAIFIAVKDVNPQSSRPLVSREKINELITKYPFIQINSAWTCLGDVILDFKTRK